MMFTTWLCINSNFSLLHPYQDSGTLWLLRIDLVVCTGEGRCTISDIAWDHALSLLSLYASSALEKKKKKKKNAWSQVISDFDTSSTKSLPRVHRVVVFKTKFRHRKTQVERTEFKRMLIFWWKKKSFQLQILPLRTLNVFSSLCKMQRIEGRIKTFQMEAEPKIKWTSSL